MRVLEPPVVYVCDRVLASTQARERVDRVMTRVRAPEVRTVTVEERDALTADQRWRGSRRGSGRHPEGDPPILFDVLSGATAGYIEGQTRDGMVGPPCFPARPGIRDHAGCVCQPGYGFHTAYGCLFRCDYCRMERILALAVNLEEILDWLDQWVRKVEGPTLWKRDNETDTFCFEPEMGAVKMFVEYFAQFDDKYLTARATTLTTC